ncbi:MAG: hypothetical protein ACTSPI_17260, partial [Candidatus Heimdallarchaeaceae archaeon]
MTAAVYKNKALYFRGVDVLTFWHFTEYTLIEGEPLGSEDTYNVSIGTIFAEKNNLKVGDFITVFSTHSDSALELRVKSIIYTGTLLDDEIIAPLEIGQFLTFESFNYITHLRVKIDPEITTKEKVRNTVLKTYPLDIYVNTYNQTKNLNATVYVQDLRGEIINTTKIINDNHVTFNLPFRMYEVYAEIEEIKSNKIKVLMGLDTAINITVPFMERVVNFTVLTQEKEPIYNAQIKIESEKQNEFEEYIEQYIYTNQNGIATIVLHNGSYLATISYDNYIKRISFVTTEENEFEIILIKKHPELNVFYPINGTYILGNLLNISISSSPGYSTYYYFDGNSKDTFLYHSEYSDSSPPDYIIHKFYGEEGQHTLTVFTKNRNYNGNKTEFWNETKIFFNIIEQFPEELNFTSVMNCSNIQPNQLLQITFPFNFSYNPEYKWDSQSWTSFSDGTISAVSTVGIHSLYIKLFTGKKTKIYRYLFSVTEQEFRIGILGLPYHHTLRTGDEIEIWYNNISGPIYYSWDNKSAVLTEKNETIKTDDLIEGNHSLEISTIIEEAWFNRTYKIIIDNSPPNITLSVLNNSLVNSGDSIQFYVNESLDSLLFSWDGLDYSYAYSQSIPVPFLNGPHSLKIMGIDLTGNQILYTYNFSVVNQTITNTIDFFLTHEYHGVINQTFINLEIVSNNNSNEIYYSIEGTTSFSGNYTESINIALYPGEYNLTIYWLNGSTI